MHGRRQLPPHTLVDGPQNLLVASVQFLLSHGTGTREKGQDWPELAEAAIGGHAVVVRLLLNTGAAASDAALTVASQTGHLEVVKLLLRHRDSAKQPPGNEPNALHMAARFGHIEVAELLLKRGADIQGGSLVCDILERSVLCYAQCAILSCFGLWNALRHLLNAWSNTETETKIKSWGQSSADSASFAALTPALNFVLLLLCCCCVHPNCLVAAVACQLHTATHWCYFISRLTQVLKPTANMSNSCKTSYLWGVGAACCLPESAVSSKPQDLVQAACSCEGNCKRFDSCSSMRRLQLTTY